MRNRTVTSDVEIGMHEGLAYARWLPDGDPAGGLVIVHGAGSCKESHFDFGRAARGMGLAAVAFDQRGHGDSEGMLDDRIVDDVATVASLLPSGPLAIRGSSMGGYVALLAAHQLRAAAVVAICPAGSEHLLRGLRDGRFDFQADEPKLARYIAEHDLTSTVQDLETPLLLLHAEGDEQINVEHSAELHRAARMPTKRFIELPGGHHRSVQHDAELQGESLRFVLKAFAGARAG